MMLDPRLTPARDGLAASELEGLVAAARYVQPAAMQVVLPVAGLRRAPERSAEQLDQLLFGERFDVLEMLDGWAFGQARRDGYVGFVRAETLLPAGAAATHWVSALRTFAFDAPSIKTAPRGRYSMNALVRVEATDGRFAKVAGSGWIFTDHLSPFGAWASDPAGVAERYLAAPYLWGGRDSLGLDCSGLVQQAMYACGSACARDSDLQRALGEPAQADALIRSDLVFWRGHVGIMLDGERLLHANAHHMTVAIEPLAQAVARIAASGSGEPLAYRRLTPQRTPVPADLAPGTSR